MNQTHIDLRMEVIQLHPPLLLLLLPPPMLSLLLVVPTL
uniref:Uncharacterized protein n=1 Tax=Picea glauca TaxID=3330 RepID=A0A117NI48_PICGL|nr:hypothetical protein ABT39_MTgene3950 [Picea glauca]QHR91064.1 hypothetical protein Q903MT_gene5096 [Picea sitchensis]